MEPSPAATQDRVRPRTSGPIGIAVNSNRGRLTAELVEAAMGGASDLGYDARIVRPGDDQDQLGVLLGIGNPDSFLPVFAAPPGCPRVIWSGEPLPLRDEPPGGWLRQVARSSLVDHLRLPLRPFKNVPLPGPLARLRASATLDHHRARYVRELSALARTADRVVVTSRDRQAALRAFGIDAEAVPFGYSPATAGPITPPGEGSRDLAFVSLGALDARLAGRRSVLAGWQAEEPRLTMLDGVWGEERGSLLRRSRVVLHVGRTPGTFVGVRLVLAIAAGAVVVSEPMTDPFPFVAGVHFVEAPLEGLLGTARDLHADEPRRRRIADAGQALLADELSMQHCLARALGFAA